VADSLLIRNCGQVLTLRGGATLRSRAGQAKRGKALGELGIVRDGAVLARDGRVAAVGTRGEVERTVRTLSALLNSKRRQGPAHQRSISLDGQRVAAANRSPAHD
jgi:hypothetical protein